MGPWEGWGGLCGGGGMWGGSVGRSVTLCVGEADEALSQRCRAFDVACDPVPLQKLFVYLAGQKEA